MLHTLVIGQGSIGRRHARLLCELGHRVALVSKTHAEEGPLTYRELTVAVRSERPDYVVIANATADHFPTLSELADLGFLGRVLVEKPLFDRCCSMPANLFSGLAVGYNLRFHPVLRELKRRLEGHKIITVEVYAGQYLPNWRPGTDYRTSYSAVRSQGGVLRDLSHELDLIQWLFGQWSRLASIGGKLSRLEIASDDVCTVLMEMSSGAVLTLQLNYLDRPGRRRISVIAEEATFVADLSSLTLTDNGTPTAFKVERDDTYRAEHQAVLMESASDACSLEEGQCVMETITAIERAAAERCFVERGGPG